jgi:CGNR zinc finger protein
MSHQKLPTIAIRVVKVPRSDSSRPEWRGRQVGGETVFDCKWRRGVYKLPDEIDAREIKQKFLAIRSEQDALSFLEHTGAWANSRRQRVAMKDLFGYQEWFKDLATQPLLQWKLWSAEQPDLDEWLSKNLEVSIAFTKADGGEPVGRIECEYTFDAILSQLKLEKVCNSEYKRCERPDCLEVYKRESRHGRKYCSPRCAHLVAVRRSRQGK